MAKITGKGSFRGVSFLIEDDQGINGGRRLVKHEYPLREDGLTEDLGKRLRAYYVRCLVVGDDHVEQAERLIEALEKSGKGTLKHPYFGEVDVLLEDYKATHSTAHQRVTRFDITFVPALEENAPEIATDTAFGVLDEYSKTLDTLADEFAATIDDVSGFIEAMVDNPVFRLAESTVGFIETVFQGARTLVTGISAVKDKVLSIKNRINVLLLEPKMLALELQDLTRLSVQSTVSSNRQIVQHTVMTSAIRESANDLTLLQTEISQSTLDSMTAAKKNRMDSTAVLNKHFTAMHEQEIFDALMGKAQFVLKRLVLSTLAVEYGKAISDAVTQSVAQKTIGEDMQAGIIESKADIQRYIADIDEQLETMILDTADAEQWDSYTALDHFRLVLLTDLRVRGESQSNAGVVQLKDTFPALVIEHKYTGNATTWQRLTLRNGIKHPLFCLGGTEIEVLQ
ncbi:DNA circularization protein [Testudinibacter sp. P27/CKL/0425]